MGEDASGVIEVAQMQVCEDVEHLERVFQDILNKGGEGIILRDPACMYTGGRSHGYLKHKVGVIFVVCVVGCACDLLLSRRNSGMWKREW